MKFKHQGGLYKYNIFSLLKDTTKRCNFIFEVTNALWLDKG